MHTIEGCKFRGRPKSSDFIFVDLLLSHLVLQVYLNFVDDKLTAKTAKFTSLENLYVYGSSQGISQPCMHDWLCTWPPFMYNR